MGGSSGIGIGVVGDVSSSVVVLLSSDVMASVEGGTAGGGSGGADAITEATSSISESMPWAKSM